MYGCCCYVFYGPSIVHFENIFHSPSHTYLHILLALAYFFYHSSLLLLLRFILFEFPPNSLCYCCPILPFSLFCSMLHEPISLNVCSRSKHRGMHAHAHCIRFSSIHNILLLHRFRLQLFIICVLFNLRIVLNSFIFRHFHPFFSI